MDNVFITELMDWKPAYRSRWVRAANAVLGRLGSQTRVVPLHGTGSMSNTEQRMNLFHLLRAVLVYGVPGDVVDVGVRFGETGALFGILIREYAPGRRVHGYDVFWDGDRQMDQVRSNFRSVGADDPVLHKGRVQDTLPAELPEQVCFASIDIGSSDNEDIAGSVRHCLGALYPVMAPGAVCVVQDYCDPKVADTFNPWPAVKDGADAFFADKPESMSVLYCAGYSHGYFRKL